MLKWQVTTLYWNRSRDRQSFHCPRHSLMMFTFEWGKQAAIAPTEAARKDLSYSRRWNINVQNRVRKKTTKQKNTSRLSLVVVVQQRDPSSEGCWLAHAVYGEITAVMWTSKMAAIVSAWLVISTPPPLSSIVEMNGKVLSTLWVFGDLSQPCFISRGQNFLLALRRLSGMEL